MSARVRSGNVAAKSAERAPPSHVPSSAALWLPAASRTARKSSIRSSSPRRSANPIGEAGPPLVEQDHSGEGAETVNEPLRNSERPASVTASPVGRSNSYRLARADLDQLATLIGALTVA